MDLSPADQYFELALDLPEKKREKMLKKLEGDDPEFATEVRGLLQRWLVRGDLACRTATTASNPKELDELHHVAVPVDHIGRAVTWYRERFACAVDYEDESWALLRFANFRLALVLPGKHPAHFAVLRQDAERFGELRAHRDGSRSIYVTDPWGNAVEVLDSASI